MVRLVLTSVSFAALAVSSVAHAQSRPSSPDQEDGRKLQEIIVTGDRTGTRTVQVGSFRGANQLDVPLTVSVMPQELLQTQNARTLADALKNTAGVSQSQLGSTVYSYLAIRGIDIDNRTNYRMNGSLPMINLIGLPLENKDRVEALKGAAALYYGLGTPSGIVNMVTERPTEKASYKASLIGNSRGALGGVIDYGNTWGIFGVRLNGVYSHEDSGNDLTSGHRALASAAFDLKPTDNLTFTLDSEYIETNIGEVSTYRYTTKPRQTVGNPYPTAALPTLRDNRLNFGPGDWARTSAHEYNILFGARWRFAENWEATFSAGHSDFERYRSSAFVDFGAPLGNGNYTLTSANAPKELNSNTNFRFEIAGAFDVGPTRHNVMFGISDNVRKRDNPNNVNTNFIQNIANPVRFAKVPFLAPNYNAGAVVDARKTQINDRGYYVFDRMSIGSIIDLVGGIRFSEYKEAQRVTGVTTYSGTPTSLSYGAIIKPMKGLSFYGSYIDGLEAPSSTPQTAANSSVQLPPTKSKQYEAGVKFEPRSGILLTAAYFNIDRGSAYLNASNLYVSDGRQVYKGGEFSASGRISSDLTLTASAMLLDAKYTKGAESILSSNAAGQPLYLNAATNQCTTTVPAANAANLRCQSTTIVGNRIDNAPKSTFSIFADYRLSAIARGLSVNAGAFHVGSRALNAQNLVIVPGFTVFNLGAAYETKVNAANMTLRLTWDNVGNKRYWSSVGADFLAQSTPSVVKFSLDFSM